MSKKDIDRYLEKIEEPKKGSLIALRKNILELLPEAEECISYGIPAFRVKGKAVAGFAAFKNHCAYFPFSGSILNLLGDQLANYELTKSSLHFPPGKSLPKSLVKKLIRARVSQAFPEMRPG
jgi:uncharacterized protein YdhG (YjbR/CyaY superfamily)